MRKGILLLFLIPFCGLLFAQQNSFDKLMQAKEHERYQNYFYALVDYYDLVNNPYTKTNEADEAYSRISSMIKSGKASYDELDVYEFHDAWFSILRNYEKYWTENCPYSFLVTDLKLSSENGTTQTGKYTASVVCVASKKYQEIYDIVKSGFDIAYDSDWSGVDKNWPKSSVYKKSRVYLVNNTALLRRNDVVKISSLELINGQSNYVADFTVIDSSGNVFAVQKGQKVGGPVQFDNINLGKSRLIEEGLYKVVLSNLKLAYGSVEKGISYFDIVNVDDLLVNNNSFAEPEKDNKIVDNKIDSSSVSELFAVNLLDVEFNDDEEIGELYNSKTYEEIQQELKSVEKTPSKIEKRKLKEYLDTYSKSIDVQRIRGINFNMMKIDGGYYNYAVGTEKKGDRVYVDKFELGQTEVPQLLYIAVTELAPSQNKGKYYPVERVSWFDAIYFCNKLSLIMGYTPCYSVNGRKDPKYWKYVPNNNDTIHGSIKCDFTANGFRLPTELEWEYAAREGKRNSKYKFSGSENLNEIAWNEHNSDSITHTVGTKKENALGLFDMSGNVWEWCWDSFDKNKNESSNALRIVKGGAFYCDTFCYVSSREKFEPSFTGSYCGFRLCRTIN